MTTPVEAYLGLGSNLGDGRRNLIAAWERLGRVKGIALEALSRPWRSAPVGIASEHWFTNAVGRIKTILPPDKLLVVMLAIELESGRDRSRGPDRQLDLDLLIYGEQVVALAGCTVPHPAMTERLFVLAPLLELAPDLLHPQLKSSIRELYRAVRAGGGQEIEAGEWPRQEAVLCPL